MKKSTELKEFFFSSWAINHSTVVYVIIFLFFFLGIYSYFTMPRENFPEIQETEVFVNSAYPGNTAEDIERLITDPLEKLLKGVQNVKQITSSSVEDFSMITIEFDEKITVDLAKQKVQDKINEVVADPDWPTFNNSKIEPKSDQFWQLTSKSLQKIVFNKSVTSPDRCKGHVKTLRMSSCRPS